MDITTSPQTFEIERAWGSHSEAAQSRYDANLSKAERSGQNACLICGRGVKAGSGSEVHLIDGGSVALRKDLEPADAGEDGAGDMGFWTLGPECQRQVPAAYRTAL